jgi:Big-like domain-containing protein
VRGVREVREARRWIVPVLAMLSAAASAQPLTRYATTAEALVAAPVFFHGKQIAVRHPLALATGIGLFQLKDTRKPVFIYFSGSQRGVTGDVEVRGEFYDLGRLDPANDPRFSHIDFTPILNAVTGGQWPARDQVCVILNATMMESTLPAEPTIRALALAPDRYVGKGVTVVGRFRGANLYADLPQSAGTKGRWDFVLQSADAAIWVTGLRPRGKGFDLDVNTRIDTGRWLKVSGTVRREGALPWIEATALEPAAAPTEAVEIAVPTPPREPEPPPRVVFSAPTNGETDADRAGPIRIQFSRDMDEKTFKGRVRLTYVGPTPPGAPSEPPTFTLQYVPGSRGLELKLASPLDRFRTVKVDLLEGIASAIDNLPLAPVSIAFTTGG